MAFEDEPYERGLRDHLGVLRRRWPVLLAVTIVAVLGAVVMSSMQTERYRASARVLVPQDPATITEPVSDQLVEEKRLDPERLVLDEVQYLESQVVRERVIDEIGRPASIDASPVIDSDVIVVTATAGTAERAAEVANAFAASYVLLRQEAAAERAAQSLAVIEEQIVDLEERIAEIDAEAGVNDPSVTSIEYLEARRNALSDQLSVWHITRGLIEGDADLSGFGAPEIISPASTPADPFQPATGRNVAVALFVGLGLGLVAAYVLDHLDDRVRSLDRLDRAAGVLPCLGTCAAASGSDGIRTLSIFDPVVTAANTLLPLDDALVSERGATAQVLVVPHGSRMAAVRDALELAGSLGLPVVATLLEQPAGRRGVGAAGTSAATADGGTRKVSTEQPLR